MPDATNIINMIISRTVFCNYLSRLGQRNNKRHTQIFEETCNMDSVLSSLDFVVYVQMMFQLEDNKLCLFFVQHKHVCPHPGTDICQAVFRLLQHSAIFSE